MDKLFDQMNPRVHEVQQRWRGQVQRMSRDSLENRIMGISSGNISPNKAQREVKLCSRVDRQHS